MTWSFVAGLFVAFMGAFFAYLFMSYRNDRQQHEELISILAQLAELDKETMQEAGRAASTADKKEIHPVDLPHPGNRVWRLRERLLDVAAPRYAELSDETKNSIQKIDEAIM